MEVQTGRTKYIIFQGDSYEDRRSLILKEGILRNVWFVLVRLTFEVIMIILFVLIFL
jgi:hypothetical protein